MTGLGRAGAVDAETVDDEEAEGRAVEAETGEAVGRAVDVAKRFTNIEVGRISVSFGWLSQSRAARKRSGDAGQRPSLPCCCAHRDGPSPDISCTCPPIDGRSSP